MSPFRPFLLVCLLCLVALDATAQDKPPAPTKPTDKAPRTQAEQLLDNALDRLAKTAWLETQFTHSLRTGKMPYAVQGKIVAAQPEKKVCYESRVKLGNSSGLLRVQCDGTNVWRTLEAGESREIKHYTLADLQAARSRIDSALLGPELTAQLLRDDDSEHGFLGVQPALIELKEKLSFPKHSEATLENGKPVYVLEGQWSPAMLDRIAPKKKEGATGADLREAWEKRTGFERTPRSCKVYLGRDNLWPYRIEWIGPLAPGGKDEALVRIDYSEPTLDKPSAGFDPARVFQPSEEDRKAAEALDPAIIVRAREDNLLRQRRQEEEASRDKSPLDLTTPEKRP